MPSTPKYSRPPSPVSHCRDSGVSVAPYLTHVVTHHGQITLVPPQNQGRLRKNKKPHQTKPAHLQLPPQEYVHVLPTRSASPGSLSFSQRQKLRNSQEVSRTVVANAQNSSRGVQSLAQGSPSTRQGCALLGTSVPSLPPPPSYDFVRSDVTRAFSTDVITHPSSPSSSSDEFEDITETDLESQWEVDRMVGLTLEERVRREWHRQQEAINASQPAALGSQGERSTETGSKASRAQDDSTSPKHPSKYQTLRRTGKDLSATSLQGTSGSSAQTVVPGNVSPISLYALTNSSKSSLDDWDLLESPPPSRPSQGQKVFKPLGASEHVPQEYTASDVESLSTVSSSSSQEDRPSEMGRGPITVNIMNGYDSTDHRSIDNHSDKYETGPSSSESGEHKIHEVRDGKRLSLIHNRPLPMPPVWGVPIQVAQPPEASTSGISLESSKGSSSCVVYSGASSSVRDRITKFETMRDRPVPPPPADFLRTRVRRKPPPPPPPPAPLIRPEASGERCVSEKTVDMPHPGPSESVSVPSGGTPSDDTCSSRPRDIPRVPNLSQQQLELVGRTPPLPSISGLNHCYAHGNPSSPSDPEHPDRPLHSSENDHHVAIDNDIASSATGRHHFSDQRDVTQGSTHEILPINGFFPLIESGGTATTLSEYTDLDVLLSRLDDEASSGGRYEDLLLVSDILGPARPESPTLPLTQTRGTLGDLPLGKIEVVRRRKLQDGRVKLKLSLLGVVVDRCQVCLSQFKDAEWAVLLPCIHSYHSTCLQSWLTRSHTCPLCRFSLVTSD